MYLKDKIKIYTMNILNNIITSYQHIPYYNYKLSAYSIYLEALLKSN